MLAIELCRICLQAPEKECMTDQLLKDLIDILQKYRLGALHLSSMLVLDSFRVHTTHRVKANIRGK